MSSNQLNLFNWDLEHKRIAKPIRLIELFSGVGAQYKSLRVISEFLPNCKVESRKTCERSAQSIKAYNQVHIRDFTDYSVNLTKEELISYLQGNISTDSSTVCDVTKQKESWLRETYNNCIATHNLMNIMKVKGGDLEVKDTDKYEYIMTYSFPCQ